MKTIESIPGMGIYFAETEIQQGNVPQECKNGIINVLRLTVLVVGLSLV